MFYFCKREGAGSFFFFSFLFSTLASFKKKKKEKCVKCKIKLQCFSSQETYWLVFLRNLRCFLTEAVHFGKVDTGCFFVRELHSIGNLFVQLYLFLLKKKNRVNYTQISSSVIWELYKLSLYKLSFLKFKTLI